MKKILASSLLIFSSIALSVIALGVGGSQGTQRNVNADFFAKGQDVDMSSAVVQLKGDPLSVYSATKPAAGRKIDFKSVSVRTYRAQLLAGRNEFKRWLRTHAPSATVTNEFDISLNAVAVDLNGTPLATIAAAPMVERATYSLLYHPSLNTSYQIINATHAWNVAGGRSVAGAGIKIGDIDTGIDQTHPFFDPTGFSYPPGFPKCDVLDSNSHRVDQDCKYVTPKVIVAKVFYGRSRAEGLDALAVQDHGSHTAGIAAGVTGQTAVSNGVSIGDISGIAPGAWLGNYNVFPGDVLNARSQDILGAVEAGVEDGMDVLNMSLGGTPLLTEENDLLAVGVNNAVDAGVVVAIASGNSGPGARTVESPGTASKAITVGASTNKHFVGQPITYPATGGTTVGAAVGDFDSLPAMSFDLFDTASDGCTSVDPGASGKLAIINRGTCSFSQKVANAKAVGALGALIINNVAGDPIAMARTAGFDDDLPAVMLSQADGATLRSSGATTASADSTFQQFFTNGQDILAGFSSQGPTNSATLKPDITSVGVNVLSSVTCVDKGPDCPGDGSGWAFFQGTSMATPHIAGSAAVLLALHPDWSPAQIKSALVNHADLLIKDAITGAHDVGPRAQGSGRENLSVAADASVWMDPASASFRKIPVGNATSVDITLYNPTGNDQTFTVSATKFIPDTFGGTVASIYNAGTLSAGDDQITVPASVVVPANGSTTLTVSVSGNLAPDTVVQGWINLRCDDNPNHDLHFAYGGRVEPKQ